MKPTLVLVHGSWHDGAIWHKVLSLLRPTAQALYAPTLIGSSHDQMPGPEVGLDTHTEQVIELLESLDLREVVLIGHSYAGLVISQVAARLHERVSRLVFFDAFVPEHGESLYDLNPGLEERFRPRLVDDKARSLADGAHRVWLLPPGEPHTFGVSDPDDVAWLSEHLYFTPEKTFRDRVDLGRSRRLPVPGSFVRCTRFSMDGPAGRARDHGWPQEDIDAGHDAMLTAPTQSSQAILRLIRP